MSRLMAFFILAFTLASATYAEDQIIKAPNEGWHLRVNAPAMKAQFAVAPAVYSGQADRLLFTVYVAPPKCPGPGTPENMYSCFIPSLLNDRNVLKDTIKAIYNSDRVLVMAMSRVEIDGRPVFDLNAHLLFAPRGKWAGVHAHILAPTKDDVRTLAALMDSIRIEPDPVFSDTPDGVADQKETSP